MAKMGTGIDNSKWKAEPLGKTPKEVLEKAKKSYISALKNSGLTIEEMMERFLKYRRAHDNSKKTYEYYVGIIEGLLEADYITHSEHLKLCGMVNAKR